VYHEVRNTHINIGTGIDISKPDGTMRKLTNEGKLWIRMEAYGISQQRC
jgi:hypothetical protein